MKKRNERIKYAAQAMGRARVYATIRQSLTEMRAQLGALSRVVDDVHAAYTAQLTAESYDEAKCQAAKTAYDNACTRYKAMKGLIAEEEKRQSERSQAMGGGAPQATLQHARGTLFRAMLLGGDVRKVMNDYQALLGSFPEGTESLNGGENFLPETVSSTLIHEAFERVTLLSHITTTAIPGLKMPRISYTLDDDDDVQDGETAKLLALKGDQVVFERRVSRVYTEVSNSVMNGAVVDLDGYIMNTLEDGLNVKTLRRLLTESPKAGEEHMSVYSTETGIKVITGATLYAALLDAIADLPDAAQDVAEIVMRRADYNKMLRELSGDESLFGRKPEEILGVPVIFTNRAVHPFVGDLSQIHHNYEGLPTQDSDKVITRGVRQFAIEADDDIQIKLPTYLRIAKVGA